MSGGAGAGLGAWLERVRQEYWDRLEAAPEEERPAGTLHVLFALGPRRFAVDAVRCKAVVRRPRVSRLPMVPGHILGVAGIRGEVFSVVDPVRLLGLDIERTPGPGFLLVVAGDDARTALWVDHVVDVVPVAADEVAPFEAPWPGAPDGVVRGRVDLGEPVVVLDAARLVSESAVDGE